MASVSSISLVAIPQVSAPGPCGLTHQPTMPTVAGPEGLLDGKALAAAGGTGMPEAIAAYFGRERPIALRPVDLNRYLPAGAGGRAPDPIFNVWLRAASALPDDPALHRAVLAYASDMTLLEIGRAHV